MAAEWLTISPLSGNGDAEVTVTAAEHTGRSIRNCTIKYIADGEIKAQNSVIQYGKTEFVEIEASKELSTQDSSTVIKGKSNSGNLTISLGEGDLELISPSHYDIDDKSYNSGLSNKKGDNAEYEFKIYVQKPKDGTIGPKTRQLIVTDNASHQAICLLTFPEVPTVSVPKGEINFNAEGGIRTISLKSNTDWTIEQA